MAAADAAGRSCGEQQRVTDPMICDSSRIFSLLTPVLWPAVSFCPVIPVLHDCSVCDSLGAAIVGRNRSMLGHSLRSVSLSTHHGGDYLHNTGSEMAATLVRFCTLLQAVAMASFVVS